MHDKGHQLTKSVIKSDNNNHYYSNVDNNSNSSSNSTNNITVTLTVTKTVIILIITIIIVIYKMSIAMAIIITIVKIIIIIIICADFFHTEFLTESVLLTWLSLESKRGFSMSYDSDSCSLTVQTNNNFIPAQTSFGFTSSALFS